jgi:beta-lactamase regulating signal transducer with metallopeptidase domain
MSGFIHYLLMTSAQASVIIIALLASWHWLTPRVSAKWLYAFWVVAILRLVIPGTLPGGMDAGILTRWRAAPEIVVRSGQADSGLKPPVAPEIVVPSGPTDSALYPPVAPDRVRASRRLPVSAGSIHAEHPSALQARRSAWEWPTLLRFAWLVGVLVGAAWMLWQHFRLWLMVRRSRAVTDLPVIAMLDECKALMGVWRKVGLDETPGLRGPALVGVWRPRILLPAGMPGKTPPSEIRHVILHELAHLRRWDLAMNWLAAWVSILHWFNPLVRLACSRMRRQQEIACDDKVLAALSPREWREYGHTLVNLSGSFTPGPALGRVGILENNQQLEQRIIMISNHHRSITTSRIAPAILLGLSTVSILNSSAADNPSHPGNAGRGQATNPALHAEGTLKTRIQTVEGNATAPIVVNSPDKPTTAEVLTDLFGINTTADHVANAADQISSLWFFQSFEQNKERYLAFFVKSLTIDPVSKEITACHVAGASISIAVYQEEDHHWRLFSKQLNVGNFGSWGDVPETKNAPTLQLSPDNLAFLIEDASSGQGYTEVSKGLLVFNAKTKTWKDAGFVQTGGDYAGVGDDTGQTKDNVLSARWKFTGEITLSKSGNNPDFPDLLVVHQGTISNDENKIVPVTNQLYVFDAEQGQYIKKGAKAR